MQILTTPTAVQSLNLTSLGFVPTMGALHIGHESLLERSKKENTHTILSIFVNPKQFNDKNDYLNYPNTLDKDIEIAKRIGVDYLFLLAPEIFGTEFALTTQIITNYKLSQKFEGEFRPGHFSGMLDIVLKLLNIVRPTKLYLGEKDYQQYYLVTKLIEDYFLNTEVIPCPTIREESFLPFSSRNSRLSTAEKEIANIFASIFKNCTATNLTETKNLLAANTIKLDYLEQYENRIFVAVRIGSIRIIDNKEVL